MHAAWLLMALGGEQAGAGGYVVLDARKYRMPGFMLHVGGKQSIIVHTWIVDSGGKQTMGVEAEAEAVTSELNLRMLTRTVRRFSMAAAGAVVRAL